MTIKVLASGSKGNCYLISDGKTSLLLDAGIPISAIRYGCDFHLSSVSGAFISHSHGDHCAAVGDLIKTGIDVYAHEDVFVKKKVGTSRRVHLIQNSIGANGCIINGAVHCGSFEVIPFAVHHDVPNLGFYIVSKVADERLLYFTDTYYIEPVFKGLNYIMGEANYSSECINDNVNSGRLSPELKSRIVKAHMSIDTFIEMLKANDLSKMKQVYLLHLSDGNSNAAEFKRRVQEVAGCEVYVY